MYDEAIKIYSSFNAWYNKGLALNKLGRYDEAIKAYDEAIRLDPNYAYPWYNRGRTLKLLGRTTEADAAFAKTRELVYTD